jgi:hypothetical protein
VEFNAVSHDGVDCPAAGLQPHDECFISQRSLFRKRENVSDLQETV